MKTTKHINYIDSLKGISAIWVTLAHYLIAFMPFGFVGWSSGVADADKYKVYFDAFPYSILSNSSFPLYTFFAIISYILATNYFQKRNVESIKKQAIKRYFRFLPPVLITTLICYLIPTCGLAFNAELSKLAPSNWIGVFYQQEMSLTQAFISGVYTAFIDGDGSYCSVLWCLNVIFIGSYISYAILLMFGESKARWLVYCVGLLLCYLIRYDYAAFIAGIAAADIAASFPKLKSARGLGAVLIVVGLIFGNCIPFVWNFAVMPNIIIYCVGNFTMLLGFSLSARAQNALGGKFLSNSGKWSFALILAHFPVLISFSAWLFALLMKNGYSFAMSMTISWIASIPVLAIATYLFYIIVEKPSEKFARAVYQKLM